VFCNVGLMRWIVFLSNVLSDDDSGPLRSVNTDLSGPLTWKGQCDTVC